MPAIPPTKLSVDEEMTYIQNSDQADRKAARLRLILHNRRTIKRILFRDSLRLSRVSDLKKADLLQSDTARFSAGIILFHNGLPKKALYQFNMVNAQTKDKAMRANAQTWINICVRDTMR
jgi:hypothetical protein